MIGEAGDAEAQQVRQAVLARYIHQLYEMPLKSGRSATGRSCRRFSAWHAHPSLEAGEEGLGATRSKRCRPARPDGSEGRDEAQAFVAGLREEEITAFLKEIRRLTGW